MGFHIMKPRFDLGAVYATSGAMVLGSRLPGGITSYLRRHHCGDWGDLDAEDQQHNEDALAGSMRLLSAYQTQSGERLYIITEWDRLRTTILLASEY